MYVTGGKQRKSLLELKEWVMFEAGMVLEVDPAAHCVQPRLEYVSPPEALPDEGGGTLFKAGAVVDGRFYVCTSTEVLIYEAPDFAPAGYLSLPCFQDLHHACPTPDGTLLVVSTGLDLVLETTPEGRVLREWSALGGDPWQRFSRAIDYRKVASTKPHASHPNYAFLLEDEVWVTRFAQRDAICLTAPQEPIHIDIERPHDGILQGDSIYFTTVNGWVVIADRRTRAIQKAVDLNQIANPEQLILGWCRGVLPVDGRYAWVGFSRIRPTKFQENLRWMRSGFRPYEKPTRIALCDLEEQAILQEIDLEPYGLNSVFSILPADDPLVNL